MGWFGRPWPWVLSRSALSVQGFHVPGIPKEGNHGWSRSSFVARTFSPTFNLLPSTICTSIVAPTTSETSAVYRVSDLIDNLKNGRPFSTTSRLPKLEGPALRYGWHCAVNISPWAILPAQNDSQSELDRHALPPSEAGNEQ